MHVGVVVFVVGGLIYSIVGKRNSAVLISHDDWTAIQETLYLASVPGMRESIKKGMETPVDKCAKELKW